MTTDKGGRPPVGPTVHVKLPADIIRQLDELAGTWGLSRSETIRRLLELALGYHRSPS